MIGIDVVDIERFRAATQRSPRLIERLFTAAERSYCERSHDPLLHLAGTLAAKEATIKALRLGPLIAWASRIEITREEGGAPTASVAGTPPRSVAVSISHDGPVAAACALDVEGLRGPL
jgi:holo-[acyl-carrier protein] synthase